MSPGVHNDLKGHRLDSRPVDTFCLIRAKLPKSSRFCLHDHCPDLHQQDWCLYSRRLHETSHHFFPASLLKFYLEFTTINGIDTAIAKFLVKDTLTHLVRKRRFS